MADANRNGAGGCILAVIFLGAAAWFINQNLSAPPASAPLPQTDYNTAEAPLPYVAVPPSNQSTARRYEDRPSHNYEFEEQGRYGYFSAVSDEERAKGRASGRVFLYAYRGASGGIHRLTSYSDSGAFIGNFECANPCVVIRMVENGETIRRTPYNPDSVIGGAFEDAIAGRLRVFSPPAASRPPPAAIQEREPPPAVELPHPGQRSPELAPNEAEPSEMEIEPG